ncbi:MAG: hypoxanthine phosphoribosyltransferase [Deltaproteobacteria bacterium]|nr:hypoxanthine phosphoribosyltransferase [Deltaproteobacteria bacterium]
MDIMTRKMLYSKEEIDQRVRELADRISRDYEGREILVVGILKGAFVFLADLIRCISVPCEVDFTRLASYGAGTVSSGNIVITKNIECSIKGRDVLIVEDIIDTGLTLSYLVERLKEEEPRSVRVCAFIDKIKRREIPFVADYVGFTMDDGFVVGYGLDADEKGRSLPDIYIIEE